MPRISEFFGVVTYMYFNDHLPPHFHAEYGEVEAVYTIETLDTLRGQLPRRAYSMVVEWALAHRPELRANWDRAREQCPSEKIEPLAERTSSMQKLGPRVRVRAVEPRQGFKALFTFDNGTQREIDLEKYLHGPIFEPLRRDPAKFRAMKVEGGTIAWDNGADIDPDVLYYDLKPAWRDEAKPAKA